MASVNVSFFRPKNYSNYSVIGPVRASEDLSSSDTSSATTTTAIGEEVALITTQGDIYIKVGESPTAAAGDLMILQGTSITVYVPEGHKVAVIDA